MIGAVLVTVLGAAVLAYVLLPLRERREEGAESDVTLEELSARKTAALAGIVDLETERDVGKLGPEDFGALRAQYEAEAVEALRDMDALAAGGNLDAEIEAEIARVRASMTCPTCGGLRTDAGCTRCAGS